MKLKYYIVVVFLLLAGLSGFLFFKSKEQAAITSYRIGVITPETGQLAFLGEATKAGLELAKDTINQHGGIQGNPIELVYADTRSSTKDGVSAAQNLMNIEKVPAIIGDITSSVTSAVAPLATEHRVVVLANGASDPKIRNAGDYVFRNWNSDDYEAKPMAILAAETLGYTRIAVLYANDDYSLGLKAAFERYLNEAGGQVVFATDYKPGEKDFRSVILKFPTDIDAVYLIGYPQDLGFFVKQRAELQQPRVAYLSSIGVESEDFLKLASDNANGLIYSAPAFDAETSSGIAKDFTDAFQARYKKLPDVVNAVSYDALLLMVEAIKKGGYSAEGIKNSLYSIKNFPGVSGLTSFDDYGDVSKPVSIKIIQGGKFVRYE